MHFDEYSQSLFSSFRDAKSSKSESEQDPASNKEFGVKVEIDDDVYKKVMHWIDKAPGEVSGLGKVIHDPETNVLRVVDAILLPQKNTGTSTELDGQAIAKAMFLTKDSPGELKWWWHSHVNMDVFWSGTDVATIKQLGGGGWFLSTVFNKKREMKSAYCQAAPIRMIVDDLETDIIEYVDEDLEKEWDAEYHKNCKIESSVVVVRPAIHSGGNDEPWWKKSASQMDAEDLAAYREVFGEDIPPELCDIYPREVNEDEVDIEQLKARGFVFEDDDEDEKMDIGPVKKKPRW